MANLIKRFLETASLTALWFIMNVNCIPSSRNNIQNRNLGLSSKSYAGDTDLAQCVFLKTFTVFKGIAVRIRKLNDPANLPLKHSILENTSLLSAPWRNAVNSRISYFSPYTQTLPSFTNTQVVLTFTCYNPILHVSHVFPYISSKRNILLIVAVDRRKPRVLQ